MQGKTFYIKHLQRVSRSFSFCILQLPQPAQTWIGLSYLLFRVLDTIEDANWQNKQSQIHQFKMFSQFLVESVSPEALQMWCLQFPSSLTTGETKLIRDTHLLLQDLKELPVEHSQVIIEHLQLMSEGMQHFLGCADPHGSITLVSLSEVNQYCFFVAGIIGTLLTYFFQTHLDTWHCSDVLPAYQFGLFLQKVNILKDHAGDLADGRCFVPNYSMVRQSIIVDAKGALVYLTSLPLSTAAKPFRLFCAWSLFIGLASLKWIEKTHHTGKRHKISHGETATIVHKLKGIVLDNRALTRLFDVYLPDPIVNNFSATELPDWFKALCSDRLTSEEVAALGLAEPFVV